MEILRPILNIFLRYWYLSQLRKLSQTMFFFGLSDEEYDKRATELENKIKSLE